MFAFGMVEVPGCSSILALGLGKMLWAYFWWRSLPNPEVWSEWCQVMQYRSPITQITHPLDGGGWISNVK